LARDDETEEGSGVKTVRRLIAYLRPHLAWAAAAVVAMAAAALCFTFLIYLLGPVIDQFLGQEASSALLGNLTKSAQKASAAADVPLVRTFKEWITSAKEGFQRVLPGDKWALMALAFLVLVVKNLLTYFGQYSLFRSGLSTVKDLRDRLFDALLGQSARFYQRQPSAVLMSRVTNDVEQITAFISDRFSDLFQDAFTIVGLLVLAFSLNFRLATGALVIAPLLIWPIVHFTKKLRHRSHQSQQRLGEMNAVLDEVLKGFRVVQAFGMQMFEALRFRDATRRQFKANLKARKAQALGTPVMEVLGGAGMFGLIYYASRLIESHQMTLGDFFAFMFALYSMYTPIKRLNKLNMAMQMAVAAGERVFAVLDEPVEIVDRPAAQVLPGVEREIRFSDVTFAYEENKPVLRGFSLVVPAGKVVALVGPSGAGKSTVAQLLPRFWDVQEGSITIDGVDIRDLTLASLRGKIGLVTQETVLFNSTIRANIAYGQSNVDEERVVACAAAAFADEFIREFPGGYDAEVGESAVRLSGGQRQRVAVARALYKNPPILVLDEATSALDAEAEAVVQSALENLMKGRSTLVIAHRLATVRNADLIAVIDEGRVVEQGSHRELLAQGGLYANLSRLQGMTE
jgi:ATP-binding cassette, subfamily B, bacterial MsbA